MPRFLEHLYVPDTILLKIVLLRYNSHIIKFTHLKCNSIVLFNRFTELYTCHLYAITSTKPTDLLASKSVGGGGRGGGAVL